MFHYIRIKPKTNKLNIHHVKQSTAQNTKLHKILKRALSASLISQKRIEEK